MLCNIGMSFKKINIDFFLFTNVDILSIENGFFLLYNIQVMYYLNISVVFFSCEMLIYILNLYTIIIKDVLIVQIVCKNISITNDKEFITTILMSS